MQTCHIHPVKQREFFGAFPIVQEVAVKYHIPEDMETVMVDNVPHIIVTDYLEGSITPMRLMYKLHDAAKKGIIGMEKL